MHISKAREQIAKPFRSQTNKFKDASIMYLLSRAKHKFCWSKIRERRKWKKRRIKHSSSKLKETFSVYDKNGDGMVDPLDLGVMIRTLGGNPTEAQVDNIITKENLNGPFSYDRFVDLMRNYLWAWPKNVELRKAFNVLDDDNDGYIDVTRLRHVMTTMGEKLDHEQFDKWIQSLGVTNDENVSYDDIIATMVASNS